MKYSTRSKHRKSCQHDPDHRAQLGHRLRTARASLGWSVDDAAKYFQVTDRTWHNWEIGAHRIPFAVYKLCRVLARLELPGDAWAGWSLQGGVLVTPEGRTIKPHESSWWSLMVRNAQSFHKLYEENWRLRRTLDAVRLAQAAPVGGAQPASGAVAADASPGEAGRAAKPAALIYLIEHFRKQDLRNGANPPSFVGILGDRDR